jgi:hypothetical protein
MSSVKIWCLALSAVAVVPVVFCVGGNHKTARNIRSPRFEPRTSPIAGRIIELDSSVWCRESTMRVVKSIGLLDMWAQQHALSIQKDCKWCSLWRGTAALQRRPLPSERRTVSRYTRQCVISFTPISTAFPAPIYTKLTNHLQHYLQISYIITQLLFQQNALVFIKSTRYYNLYFFVFVFFAPTCFSPRGSSSGDAMSVPS